ncbi:MAG: class II glutamine amidotransferase, partial [Desulfobacterales bacterium]
LGSALDSERYRQAVTSIDEVPDVFLGHLRKASEDIPITLANAHPFFHDRWAFIHNGTVYDPESLLRDASLVPISDESDSEYLFHYLLSAIMEIAANNRIGETLVQAVSSLTADYTAVNSMLSNGKDLYVINGYKIWEDYYALHCYCLPAGIIISSQPIESSRLDPTGWKKLDNNVLLRIHGRPPRMDTIPIANNS